MGEQHKGRVAELDHRAPSLAPSDRAAVAVPSPDDWLVGGGEMAKVIKAKDWSNTPLGRIESWPQSLRTVVSLGQASDSPISLVWGRGHVQIYHDRSWAVRGGKHPNDMGL